MPLVNPVSGQLSISAMMDELQKQQKAANTANETRYNQALATQSTQHNLQQGLYTGAQGDVANVGQVANTRIDKQAQKSSSMGMQGLVSRGLGNTTIANSVMRGYADDAELQHQGVDEQQAQLRSGLKTQQATMEGQYGDRAAGIMERRNDVAPDTGMYAGLIQSAMAAQTGSAKPTTTQYIGSDGKSYGSAGAAMASGGMGSQANTIMNAPGGGGGSGGNTGGSPGAQYFGKGYGTADSHGSDDGYKAPEMQAVGPTPGAIGAANPFAPSAPNDASANMPDKPGGQGVYDMQNKLLGIRYPDGTFTYT